MNQQSLKLKYNISTWPLLSLNYWGITKCGNTSTKIALLNESGISFRVDSKTDSNAEIHSLSYVQYITPEEAMNNGYKNFTIVRHPYSRFISMYKDSQRRPSILGTRNIKTVDHLLNHIDAIEDHKRNVHLRSQSYFIKQGVDFYDLMNLHSIREDLSITLPHTNSIEAEIDLSNAQKNRIKKIYKEDFERFNYE